MTNVSEEMTRELIHGSCLCGAVRYQVMAPYVRFVHCHCSRCRKATGTGHATNLVVEPKQFLWTAGEALVARYDLPSAKSFATCFCTRCGSPVPHPTRSGQLVIVPAGSLDREPSLRPQARMYWESRSSWSCETDELPKFAESAPS